MMFGTIFKLGKLLPLLSKYWWVFFIIFYVLPTGIQSYDMAKEQGDWSIPIIDSAVAIGSFDRNLDLVVQDMEFEFDKKDNLDEQIDSWANFIWYVVKNLWRPLFAMIFTFFFLFKTFRFIGGNDSKSRNAVLITILVMVGLQILVAGIPFKGTTNLIKFIVEVLRQL